MGSFRTGLTRPLSTGRVLVPGLRETAESLIQAEMAEMGGLSSEHPRMPKGADKDLFEVSTHSSSSGIKWARHSQAKCIAS